MPNSDTGPCEKCHSKIPLKAKKCSQCGYEPGKPVLGPIGTILGVVLLIGAIFQVMVGILALLTMVMGVPIVSALVGGALFIGAGLFQASIANWLAKFGTHYPAEQPDSGEDLGSFMEEMNEALEEGEQRGDRFQREIRERINNLSPWVFTSSIIAGFGFIILSFVIVGANTEIAGIPREDLFIVPFIMSFAILGLTVYADVGRINRLYDTNRRWYAWSVPSMIPFIGFIPAFVWIWRRRKSEKENQSETSV